MRRLLRPPRPPRTARRPLAVLASAGAACALALGGLLAPGGTPSAAAATAAASAATGSASTGSAAGGTLDGGNTSLTWTSPTYAKGTQGGADSCPAATADPGDTVCDRFSLTVDAPAGFWDDNPEGGVPVSISWPNQSDDFDMYIYDSSGKEVAESAGTADPEATVIPNPANGTYTVLVVPYDVSNASFTGKAYLPQTTDAGDLTSFGGGHGSYQLTAGQLKGRIDFLADDQLRIQAAPDGTFTGPGGTDPMIRHQPAADTATTSWDAGAYYGVRSRDAVLRVYKSPLRLGLYKADNRTRVWQEDKPLRWSTDGMRQSLDHGAGEQFFGGGEQNGSFSHRDTVMHVGNSFDWNEGGWNNSQPFYWSSAGYGVFRNTFSPGVYDFGSPLSLGQQERRFDAYYMLGDAKRVIGDYTSLVGKPFMPPVYGLEPGDSDCYLHNANRGERHTLDAVKVADQYKAQQMPLGWMLVNDGYGCGYENLQQTGEGLRGDDAQLGLWTQNGLPNQAAEVQAGVRVRKLDVAWVGNGYDFALNACDQAKSGIEDNSDARGFVWMPNSWAGAQRCSVLWSGDQQLSWDYIRWQIPTYAGATMSGIAYDTGDVGSIYRHDPKMYTRDLEWKSFLPAIMTMDGWATEIGSGAKVDQHPWQDGEPYTSINRKYLQLKERLIPYMYTLSEEATKTGVGAVRPLYLEYPDDPNAVGPDAKEEFLLGSDFLVAPVYQDSDVRDGIYLPAGDWTDYWTGKTYHGPTTVNGYSAPLDTLPLFVKSGSIVPMWPQGTTSWQTRDKGELDYDVYPSRARGGRSAFSLYEDDGTTRQFADGSSATQNVTAQSAGGGSTVLSIGASVGDYSGKPAARSYLLTVHGGGHAPSGAVADGHRLAEASSAAALSGAASGWYYDPATGVTTVKTPVVPTGHAFRVVLTG
ncbi:TIM-barrel domain-containing protein [Phaeacidiphilus oryzae]|uniref:TIM-barrel domain-containing protein n=1 Tax=Phaeacidiphilus oryzae TaxID=348818 RepID=UPI00068A16FA|nr:TIM-barrel domain-containing protein [Phaeacidiphilus oryzae]